MEDTRGLQRLALELYSPLVVNVIFGRFVQKALEIFCGKGHRLKIGAADTRTVNRIVDPTIPPDRSQDSVLYVVESDILALDFDQLCIPGSLDLPDRRKHPLDRKASR